MLYQKFNDDPVLIYVYDLFVYGFCLIGLSVQLLKRVLSKSLRYRMLSSSNVIRGKDIMRLAASSLLVDFLCLIVTKPAV